MAWKYCEAKRSCFRPRIERVTGLLALVFSSYNDNTSVFFLFQINHVDVIDACHDVVVGLLDSLKSEPIILEVTRPYLLQQQSKSTARNNGDLVEPKHRQLTTLSKGVVRSVSMTGKLSHGNGPAPYSPLLPMHAPLNRCLSPEENSVSSSGENTYSLIGTWTGVSSHRPC